MNRQVGFTLMELIVTVAIAAILLTIGVPSFQDTMRNNRAATHMNEMMTALNLARSEAAKLGKRVSLCPSTDQATCTGGTDWTKGWIVFIDTAVADTSVTVGTVLRVWDSFAGNPTFGGPANVRYRFTGDAIAVVDFSYVLDTIKQHVCVSLVGRPRIKKGETAC